jgi:hypothetical protein
VQYRPLSKYLQFPMADALIARQESALENGTILETLGIP